MVDQGRHDVAEIAHRVMRMTNTGELTIEDAKILAARVLRYEAAGTAPAPERAAAPADTLAGKIIRGAVDPIPRG